MKIEPAAGFTALAQRGAVWNAGVLLLSGGTYYGVARQLEGLPTAAVRWAAGASAAANACAGIAIRHLLLSAHATRCVEKAEREKEEAEGRLTVALETYRSGLQPPIILAVGHKAVELCMAGGGHHFTAPGPKLVIMVIPEFSDSQSAAFIRGELLGEGGQKIAYSCFFYHHQPGSQGMKRQDQCAWIETPASNANRVRHGYEVAMALPKHPNVYRPWTFRQIGDDAGKVTHLVAVEPRFATSLDRVTLPWKTMVDCVRQIAEGLAFLHRNRVVHRDMKSSNIFLRLLEDGSIVPVIGDFDVADKLPSGHKFKGEDLVSGTPYYLSPEQYSGKNFDEKADVWALGILAFDQVWRSAEKFKSGRKVKLPQFILNALEKGSNQEIGEALCQPPKFLTWPPSLPAGGEKMKEAILGAIWHRVALRSTADDFLHALPH